MILTTHGNRRVLCTSVKITSASIREVRVGRAVAPVARFFDRIYMINRILGDKCGEADAHEPIVVPATLAFKPLAVRVC